MKRKHIWMLAAILVCGLGSVSAQDAEPVHTYFTKEQMPSLLKSLPAPPDTIGEAFAHDIMRYMWGKQMRQTERGSIAIRDAVFGVQTICNEYSEGFGLQISAEGTPEIYKLLRDGTATIQLIGENPKAYYNRKRPFDRFKEPSLCPWDDEALSHNGSYPSGHTILGWGSALLLSEVNPAATDTLMARGHMYGESRVIVGAHWQSDVDCGRLAASIAYAFLHSSPEFLDQMRRAQEEFRRLKGAPAPGCCQSPEGHR